LSPESHLINCALLGRDKQRQLGEQHLADREEIALALQIAGDRARFVLSQSCSWLRSVVTRRLSIIVLMLSLSSATSPRSRLESTG